MPSKNNGRYAAEAIVRINDYKEAIKNEAVFLKNLAEARIRQDLKVGDVVDVHQLGYGFQAKVLRGTVPHGAHLFRIDSVPTVDVNGGADAEFYRWHATATPLRSKDQKPYANAVHIRGEIPVLRRDCFKGDAEAFNATAQFKNWIDNPPVE